MFINKLVPLRWLCQQQIRPLNVAFYSKQDFPSKTQIDPETGEIKKKKTNPVPKITLISGQDITVSTLDEAQKLAKRRELKLVKIIDLDTKTQRPLYKLMSGAEYHQEDLKQREKKKADKQKGGLKGEKLLILNQKITEHDLETNIKKIIKWLTKKYEVRMVINGSAENTQNAENVYSFLEKNLSSYGRLVQKRQKGTDIKFQVIPPKKDNDNNKGPL
ncbi:unnamed protein product [Ceutorhynchus assimilis]|uniref:Translation initiation factor 3 N-terminal domain-containing protein n=1 Tax=Ceutorhynchus assimilis TaxID=467358 RepID=A0A9N9QFQ9_9CUCU|nr:unnamed protein product [Ceutorhynchus assimilis]